jgi:hypothetical protein
LFGFNPRKHKLYFCANCFLVKLRLPSALSIFYNSLFKGLTNPTFALLLWEGPPCLTFWRTNLRFVLPSWDLGLPYTFVFFFGSLLNEGMPPDILDYHNQCLQKTYTQLRLWMSVHSNNVKDLWKV